MSYRVLARKYRPQTFEEMVGQTHVSTTLTNALRSRKVAHAYLFSGPRGVGKTTTARILAKALNCVQGPTPTPCNACDSCERIAQGQEMVDVLEIDAASNRGIEEIRELRENVRYAPARSRYKVYIVDEAHQITHDAFNAFLKTLEEPPEHAVFVLATTEYQKIPLTILSRCQWFRFKRVSAEDITRQLERVLASEKVSVEKAALVRLARAAGGSVRDALSLLDQALAYTSETLTAQQVEMLLGFLPDEFLNGFAEALIDGEPATVLQWIKRLADEGWELPQFVRDFREYLQQALIEQLGAGAKPQALHVAQKTVSLPTILQMIKGMGQCLDEMRWNDNPRLVLELYSLRLTQPFVDAGVLLQRIEELEKRMGEPATGGPQHPPSPLVGEVLRQAQDGERSRTGGRRPDEGIPIKNTSPHPHPLPQGEREIPPNADTQTLWKQLLQELWKKPAVASHMERARLKSATNTEWTIAFNDKFSMDSVQRSQAFVQETLAKIAGCSLTVQFVQESFSSPDESTVVVTPNSDERLAERQPAILKDAGVQKVLQTFKGRVRLPEET